MTIEEAKADLERAADDVDNAVNDMEGFVIEQTLATLAAAGRQVGWQG